MFHVLEINENDTMAQGVGKGVTEHNELLGFVASELMTPDLDVDKHDGIRQNLVRPVVACDSHVNRITAPHQLQNTICLSRMNKYAMIIWVEFIVLSVAV